MQRPRSSTVLLIPAVILVAILILTFPAPSQYSGPAGGRPEVSLLYASAGSMPQLLNTGQVDAFLVWEPVVSNTELAGIGEMIATPAELPPPGKWENAASCVLVLRNDVIRQHPDVAALLSALTTAAINRTNEDPGLARNITTDWVFGNNPVLTPEGILDPLLVEDRSFGNMVFTPGAKLPESAIVRHTVEQQRAGTYDPSAMINTEVARQGEQFCNGSDAPRISAEVPTFSLGYLPSSDNFAPLYVMVWDSSYFCERYGFCLVPDDTDRSRPDQCTLLVNGTPAAHISLVPGQSGGGLMTAIGQEVLDGAYVGSIPAELQIALGNPSSIIQSINTGGSGLVVGPGNACHDWDSFVGWVKNRSADGRPVVIATVQSSIQEDMIRGALSYENISVKLYGTGFEAAYP